MITLNEYIFENARTTDSNAKRKQELEKWLKNKNYPDYVATLNKMLDDPKAKTLLQDGFGGSLGNLKLKFSVKNISAKSLRPTQSEIDISKSIKHGLTKTQGVNKYFNKEVIINNMPLITFRGNYVIDGHHRWAEVAAFNPDGKMVCFDYDGNISPIQMLKAVQGAIAAVMADNNDNNEKIPSGKTKDKNLFDMSKKEIRSYIEENIINEVEEALLAHNITIDDLVENIISIQNNNYPETNMPSRGEMPQTDKAGTDRENKQSSFPDKKGSALNKLKTGKIDKDAIK